MNEIVKKMTKMAEELDQLIENCTDSDQQEKLSQQLDQIYEQKSIIINKAIDEATADYQNINKELSDAASTIKKSIEDIGKVSDTIHKVASVITKINKLLA